MNYTVKKVKNPFFSLFKGIANNAMITYGKNKIIYEIFKESSYIDS